MSTLTILTQFLVCIYVLCSITSMYLYRDKWLDSSTDILRMICETITVCVHGYFVTFKFCWERSLYWMATMIGYYCDLLTTVTVCLTMWPTNIICGVTIAWTMLMFYMIIRKRYGTCPKVRAIEKI